MEAILLLLGAGAIGASAGCALSEGQDQPGQNQEIGAGENQKQGERR